MHAKVGVFIHINDQFHAVNRLHRGMKIDYAKFLQRLEDEGKIFRSCAYGVQMNDEATGFITALRAMGYEVKYKPAKITNSKPDIRHTDWYLGMAMDIMRNADKLDVVVLGTSNPDIIPLIDYLRERGTRCIVYSCSAPKELRFSCDKYIEITSDILETKNESDSSSSNSATVN